MIKYTSIFINTISFLLSIVIFTLVNFISVNVDNIIFNIDETNRESHLFNMNFSSRKVTPKIKIENMKALDEVEQQNIEIFDWYVEIPNINLKANISDGTSQEVMDDFVGHFDETSKWEGNVGLAAHNRGYKNNYFENLKYLKEGDKIYYYFQGNIREYIVNKHIIIEDTDWINLENTQDNTITLITCVENEPNYRRCVQAVESIKQN